MADTPQSIQKIKVGQTEHPIDAVTLEGKSATDIQENGLVTSIGPSSDDDHYPSAKCIYEIVYGPQPPHDYSQDYFTLDVLESGTFTWDVSSVQYSVNNDSWNTWGGNLNVNSGDKVRFKSTNSAYASKTLSATGNFNAEGNIMSLMYGDNFIGQTAFKSVYGGFKEFFIGNINIINANNLLLPATSIGYTAYDAMFNGCYNLITSPKELPATTLYNFCYRSMFSGCRKLTTSPRLPEINDLSKTECMKNMFSGCNSLNSITCLALDTSASQTQNWVNSVAATGTFTKKAGVTWSSGTRGIPSGWTVVEV